MTSVHRRPKLDAITKKRRVAIMVKERELRWHFMNVGFTSLAGRAIGRRRKRAIASAPMAMPPLGRHEVDQEGVELIGAWITAMRDCEK